MSSSTAWFVVHTRHQQDRLCADALERKGFVVYLPMRQTVVKHARREQIVMRPALGRYLFVGLDEERPQFAEVKRTLGVEWLIQSKTAPLAVHSDIIGALRRAEDAGAFDDKECVRQDGNMALPRKGDLVSLKDGPFAGMIAEVMKAPSDRRIEIIIRKAEGFLRLGAKLTTTLAKLEKVA